MLAVRAGKTVVNFINHGHAHFKVAQKGNDTNVRGRDILILYSNRFGLCN